MKARDLCQLVIGIFLVYGKITFGYCRSLIYWNVRKSRLNKTEITYYEEGQQYHIRVPSGRLIKFLIITDSDGVDITDQLKPYLGPRYDFFHQEYTPFELGYHQLTIETAEGITTFSENQVITL